MTRTWTQEEIANWKNSRNKQRRNQVLPLFDELNSDEKKTALKEQRAELFQSTLLTVRSKAWPLGRYPLSAYPAPRSGTLELPRHLSASDCGRVSRVLTLFEYGQCFLQLKFKAGDDLNLLTYRHYDQRADSTFYSGSNFVTDGSIQPKRSAHFPLYNGLTT